MSQILKEGIIILNQAVKKFITKKEKACLFKKWDQDSMDLGYCLRSIDEQKETTSTRCREY